jgi:N-acetylglutamate synthase-like GNAT family acetyltransferase
MSQFDPVTFESPAEKRIYRHVERRGPRSAEAVRESLSLPAAEFEDGLDRLRADGHLEERDGLLALAVDLGDSESVETQDFTYTIRPATEDDYEGLLALVREIAEKKTYVVAEELAAELAYDETVLRHNSTGSRTFFVATVDDEIVGWSHLDLPLLEKLRATAEVTVGVDPDYRGYSIGTELLDRALALAAANDCLKVYKNVARTNMQAVSFLEARGWEQEGVRTDHYVIGHKPVDQVMLAYTF